MANDRRVIHALAALTCWLALASSAAAQSMLGGVVSYPTGQVAADVTVVAEKEDTGETWNSRSSSLGIYSFYHLPNGTYTIRVNFSQLSFVAAGIEVRPRQKTALDIPLCICEVITVRGSSALPRRLSDGSLGAAFSREAIENMPLTNGSSLQSILGAIPGVVFTESVGTLAQFTALGQRRFSNRIAIDGISADLAIDVMGPGVGQAGGGTLPAFSTTGNTQTLIPFSAIEEIEVRTTNASPEHARTPGAQTVIVTRSGSDRFKGSAFTNVRPEELAATDWFINAGERPKRRMRYWDAGVSLGGPLFQRRVFYFGTYERQRIDRSVNSTVLVPSITVREEAAQRPGGTLTTSLLNAYPLPNGPEVSKGLSTLSRVFPAVSGSSAFSVRVDSNLSAPHRVFARVNNGKSDGDSLDDRNLPSLVFGQTESTSTTTATGGLTSAWSKATHELRMNVSHHRGSIVADAAKFGNAQALPLAPLVGQGVSVGDAWANIQLTSPVPLDAGFNIVLNAGRFAAAHQKQFEVADTWSILRAGHDWRVGFNYQQATGVTDPAANRYSYRFASIDDIVLGRPRLVFVDRYAPAHVHRQAWSLFAQDTFRASSRLSLTYGLRYSIKPAPVGQPGAQPLLVNFERLPEAHLKPVDSPLWKTSRSDLAPRITATYRLSQTERFETSVRAGWSLVFDERTNNGLDAFGGGAPYTYSSSFRPLTFPVAPTSLLLTPPPPFEQGDLSTYYSFPEDLRSPRTREWQIAIEQGLGRAQHLGIAYVGNAGRQLIYGHAYYYGVPLIGGPAVNAYSNSAESDYHALLIEYTRGRTQGLQGRVSYTWSHAIDIDSGELLTLHLPLNLNPPQQNRASADFDRRHILRLTASYPVPAPRMRWLQPLLADWHIDLVGTYQSGAPIDPYAPRDFKPGVYSVRPDVVGGVPTWIDDESSPTGRSINPLAFILSDEPRQGTLGRNSLRASSLRQVDLSASRKIHVGRLVAQLRIDAFNVLNVPSFAPPESLIGFELFGRSNRSYADGLGTGTLLRGGLAPIQQVGRSRSVQVGIRVDY